MPKQIAKKGDVFWVPIEDGSYVLGQIVEIEKDAMNSITCAFFEHRREAPDPAQIDFLKPISVQFVTKDLFNKGVWQRTGNQSIALQKSMLPYRETKKSGWVGAKIIGSGIIMKFLSSFYGLRNWHEMHDPNYYQNLLLPGISRDGSA